MFCPVLMMLGVATRLAALPVIVIVAMAVSVVHREWSIEQGQFAWMLLIIFGTIAICGPGKYAIPFNLFNGVPGPRTKG